MPLDTAPTRYAAFWRQAAALAGREVVRHPATPGKWAVRIEGHTYGCYDTYALAVAWMMSA